jgi:solute:Na+ symporter, SSS family
VMVVWFTWGGVRDIKQLFERLRTTQKNALDDGTVVGHKNLDEAAASQGEPASDVKAIPAVGSAS